MKSLLSKLIQCESITPSDAGCQAIIAEELTQLGFNCIHLPAAPVSNLFAYLGEGAPFFLFAGHTDVVPAGDQQAWHFDPFTLTEKEGLLYGRGTADMKGSLVAMIHATQQWLHHHPKPKGTLGFLITSGEEGDDFLKGTPYVMEYLEQHFQRPDFCLIGEPSSEKQIGDTLRIGRRGSLTAKGYYTGQQGHVAYPEHIENPIHDASRILHELAALILDDGSDYFPPSSLQITHLQSEGGASNMTPHGLSFQFNIRYNSLHTADSLIKMLEKRLKNTTCASVTLEWKRNGDPFLTLPGPFLSNCIAAIRETLHIEPILSTGGGTSDGRFIAPYGIPVVELGPRNHSIHKPNEHVSEQELIRLAQVYKALLEKIIPT